MNVKYRSEIPTCSFYKTESNHDLEAIVRLTDRIFRLTKKIFQLSLKQWFFKPTIFMNV